MWSGGLSCTLPWLYLPDFATPPDTWSPDVPVPEEEKPEDLPGAVLRHGPHLALPPGNRPQAWTENKTEQWGTYLIEEDRNIFLLFFLLCLL